MKKIFLFAATALFMAVACTPSTEPVNPSGDPSRDPSGSSDPGTTEEKLEVSITRRNIDIAGEFDYEITTVDAEKKIVVTLEYADRDEAQALDVEFIGLPSGVVADYTNPYDYSEGKTQEIVFKKEGSTDQTKWDVWILGVNVKPEVPHFVELSVADIAITSAEQTIRLAAGTDLSKLVVTYVVSPEGSIVKANGTAFQSGAEVDFSDQLNGVQITVEGGEDVFLVKAETSGINKVTRIWGHYLKPVTLEDSWYADVLGMDWSVKKNWDRNVAIDDNYAYLAATESNDGAGGTLAKIWAISLADPTQVVAMSVPADLSAQHRTAGLAVAPDGDGTRLLFCTMAMAAAHKYEVYSYTSPTAEPELVVSIDYSSIGKRVGDRITFFGTWEKGEICSVSWTDGTAVIVPITNGVAGSFFTADLKNGGLTTTVGGNGAKLVKYSETEYLWCGTGNPIAYTREGNTFTQTLLTTKEMGFGSPNHGFNFFEVKGEKYAVFAYRVNNYQSSEARIFAISGENLPESLANNDMSAHSWKFGLGDPDISQDSNQNQSAGFQDANGICDTAVREMGNFTYIVAAGCGSGISLIKAE